MKKNDFIEAFIEHEWMHKGVTKIPFNLRGKLMLKTMYEHLRDQSLMHFQSSARLC